MKKILLISVMLVFSMVGYGWATSYSGSITVNDGLYGTDGWSDAMLSWEVNLTGSLWTYVYTFDVDEKGISHVINEVSADDPLTDENEAFSLSNIYAGTTPDGTIDTYDSTGPGNSNPGMTDPVFGIKWDIDDSEGDVLSFEWTIVTDRAPMWGDFYAKDGVYNVQEEPTIDVYAYNTGFGSDTNAVIGNGNANDGNLAWVLVPDTHCVPEPATMLLFGTGLAGFVAIQRKKIKKINR